MSWFSNIISDVAPIAGAVGGFFLGGGPWGAAAGAALGGGLSGYERTGHLGGTLEGAALGGAAGYFGGEMFAPGGVLSSLAGGGVSASPTADALGMLTSSSSVPQAALGLGTATVPGYALPATGSSLLSDLATGAGSSVLGGAGKLAEGGNVLSGLAQLYGTHVANQNAQQLMQLVQQGNAFGPYRQQYAQQLQQLMQNPSQIQQLPGYQAGIEAINRDAAAHGYFGSGNQASALGMYGNQLFQQQAGLLSGLAGANINPAGFGGIVGSAGQSQMSGLGMLSGGLQSVFG